MLSYLNSKQSRGSISKPNYEILKLLVKFFASEIINVQNKSSERQFLNKFVQLSTYESQYESFSSFLQKVQYKVSAVTCNCKSR